MKITKPTLLIDEKRCKKNIRDMHEKANRHNLEFRPHFKTHQSLEVGGWFKERGIKKITVSSLEMAEFFSPEWDDITVAFPVNILEIDRINKLASAIQLNLLVESEESAQFLRDNVQSAIGIFIKIDLGYHRTGIDPENIELIDNILKILDSHNLQPATSNPQPEKISRRFSQIEDADPADNTQQPATSNQQPAPSNQYPVPGNQQSATSNQQLLHFTGFLSHAGHTYKCKGESEILKIHNESLEILKTLKKQYIDLYPDLIISYGDTPSCSVAENFEGIDEIRPGNFVFYDLTQVQIGSCDYNQIAVAVACPIVAVHSNRNEIVIFGGGVHFSKERIEDQHESQIYGKAIHFKNDKLGKLIPGIYLKSLSQEHGIIKGSKSLVNSFKPGDIIVVLPVHSCMTANLMKNSITILS